MYPNPIASLKPLGLVKTMKPNNYPRMIFWRLRNKKDVANPVIKKNLRWKIVNIFEKFQVVDWTVSENFLSFFVLDLRVQL